VLITCALFVCFEMFQNHHESALSQMSSGVYVYYNWQSRHHTPSLLGNSSELTRQLGRVFGRLMLQTILFIDTKPLEWKFMTPAFTPDFPSIPPVFRSVDEARDCLDSCISSIYHRMMTSQFQGLEDPELITVPTSPRDVDPLSEWLLAFRSFTTDNERNFSRREQKAGILIEIQHITASILASAGAFNESVFDKFEGKFSQIIALGCRFLIFDTSESPLNSDLDQFPAFDMGILPHLYFVASRCRHPSLRRQGLYLLRRGPRQEGIWHRNMLANIADRIMSLEEIVCESVQNSTDIPTSARLSVINATIDSAQRKVTLHCCRQQIGEEGITDVIHEIVEY
jgi:hypothetical protein